MQSHSGRPPSTSKTTAADDVDDGDGDDDDDDGDDDDGDDGDGDHFITEAN